MEVKFNIKKYQLGDKIFKLKQVKNLDDLVEQVSNDEFNIDERLPYWAELWPSAIALSRFLLNNKQYISGKKVLELGCGLGLTSLSIASLKPEYFLATDYEQVALEALKENFILNSLPLPEFKILDWRTPDISERFDIITASDILYEERFFEPLRTLINRFLSNNGLVIIAEPNRPIAKHFFVRMIKTAYIDEHFNDIVKQDEHDIKVTIHLLKKKDIYKTD